MFLSLNHAVTVFSADYAADWSKNGGIVRSRIGRNPNIGQCCVV